MREVKLVEAAGVSRGSNRDGAGREISRSNCISHVKNKGWWIFFERVLFPELFLKLRWFCCVRLQGTTTLRPIRQNLELQHTLKISDSTYTHDLETILWRLLLLHFPPYQPSTKQGSLWECECNSQHWNCCFCFHPLPFLLPLLKFDSARHFE